MYLEPEPLLLWKMHLQLGRVLSMQIREATYRVEMQNIAAASFVSFIIQPEASANASATSSSFHLFRFCLFCLFHAQQVNALRFNEAIATSNAAHDQNLKDKQTVWRRQLLPNNWTEHHKGYHKIFPSYCHI